MLNILYPKSKRIFHSLEHPRYALVPTHHGNVHPRRIKVPTSRTNKPANHFAKIKRLLIGKNCLFDFKRISGRVPDKHRMTLTGARQYVNTCGSFTF